MSVTLLPGDCRAVLATLPAASVQCVVTSPPYFGLRDYGVDGQIGLEASPDAYVAEMVVVFREVRRVLRDDGTVWLNLGDSYSGSSIGGGNGSNSTLRGTHHAERTGTVGVLRSGAKPKDLLGIPWMVAFALRADGWWLRSDIIWAKPNPMPESVTDRPTSAHEHVFLLSKRASYFYDSAAVAEPAETAGSPIKMADGWDTGEGAHGTIHRNGREKGRVNNATQAATRNLRNVWNIATSPFPDAHFATFPPELAERCIKAGTSERGQCPHCAAPWARVVERSAAIPARTGDWKATDQAHRNDIARKGGFYDATATTTGWQPTCACPGHRPVPQTVLDPFAGAGTTLLVADRLGRNGVGIELNPAYAVMARNRLTDDCPLFADVAD